MKFALALLITLSTLPAFAAKFHMIPQATRLTDLQARLEDVCKIASFVDNNCGTYVLKVDEKASAEPWANTVKQSQYSSKYVESVTGRRLTKLDASIVNALDTVIHEAQVDMQSQAGIDTVDALMGQIQRDVFKQSDVEVVTGRVTGLLSLDQLYIAFIDLNENEILILQAGYSE